MGLTRVRAEQILDIDYKQAVRVIATSNVSNLATSAPSVVDGVALSLNDRILVNGQTTPSQNGLYYAAVVGTGANGTWVRTSDGNATGEINAGMIVMVTEGNLYADTLWKLITNNPIVIDITGLEFVLNSQASFDVINANGTPVSANTVSSTINYTSGNNLVITGSDMTDTVLFAVADAPNFSGNVSTSGNLFVSRDVSITGNLTIGANLNVVNVNEYVGATGNISFLGNLLPGASNVINYSLGLPGQPWSNIYVDNLNVALFVGTNLSITGTQTSNTLVVNNDATVNGNLTVLGTTTTINSNVIVTNDKNIELANNISTLINLDGAGLQAGNAANTYITNWTYNYSANAWSTNVGVSAVGNITGNFFIGNGSQLTGLPAGYANTNAQSYFASGSSNANISITGNVLTTANVSATGNITGNFFIGNGSPLTSLTGANVTGTVANATYAVSAGSVSGTAATVTINAQPNITSTGTLANLTATGITLPYSNTLAYTANTIVLNGNTLYKAMGNVPANTAFTIGNTGATWSVAKQWTKANPTYWVDPTNGLDTNDGSINAPLKTIAAVLTQTYINSGASVVLLPGTYTETVTWNQTNVNIIGPGYGGTVNLTGTWTFTQTTGSVRIYGCAFTNAIISAAGSTYFNQCILTAISTNGTNGLGYVDLLNCETSTGGSMTLGAGNTTATAQYVNVFGGKPNGITVNQANLTVTIQGATINNTTGIAATRGILLMYQTNMSSSTATGNLITGTANSMVILNGTSFSQSTGTVGRVSLGGLYSLTSVNIDRANSTLGVNIGSGDVTDSYLSLTTISAIGNITGGNISTAGLISATGNVSVGNLNITGNIVDTGPLSIITSGNGNINLAANGTGIVTISTAVSATGNATAGNIRTAGTITAAGNVTAGNILTAGQASVAGNVTAGNIITNNVVSSGNILFTGNLLPSANTYTLGSVASPWADAIFGPQSITILDTTANTSNTVVIQNDAGNITMGTAGFEIQTLGNGTSVFRIAALTGQIFSNAQTIIANTVNSANATSGSLQTAGGAGIAKDLYVGGNIVASNLSVSGNVYSNPTYGAFSSTTTQTNSNLGNAIAMQYNTVDLNNGITVVSNSRITINKTGVYNIQFSAQLTKTDSGSDQVFIWLAKNGTAVANSTTTVWLAGNNAKQVAAWNFVISAVANDYYQIMWSSIDAAVSILAEAAAGAVPAIPSVIVTVVPVGP